MDDALNFEPEYKPRKSTSFYVQRSFGALLLVVLAGVFFYSAYTKLGILIKWGGNKDSFLPFSFIADDNSFDSFQWTFLDLGISNIFLTGVIARLMIGMELLLGLFLLCHVYLKRFTYKAVIAVLAVFIVYLLIIILKQGNTGNCGCFGENHAMKPLTAIWKNVGMIAATLLLWKIYPVKPYRRSEYVCILVAGIALSIPFLLRFMYVGTDPDKVGKPIDLAPLYKYAPAPAQELRTGKHIIAFMSLTCPHCKKAAYLLQIIHHEHPDIPMIMVLDGSDNFVQKFFDETHAQAVPFFRFSHHEDDFIKMAGTSVPSILWVNNGIVEYKSTYAYYQLDPKFMELWLKK